MPVVTLPEVRLSFPQYFRTNLRLLFKKQPTLWFILLPALSGLTVLYVLLTGQASLAQLWATSKVGLFMAAFVVGWPVLLWFSMRKQYRRATVLQAPTRYAVSETGLAVQNELVQEELSWPAVQEAWHIGAWLVLMTGSASGYFLDLRRVQSPADAAGLLSLVRAGGVTIK
ncbi:hypothetical protein E5K00_09725 [Hymenobacter aquaticus]|uniref:YcxB family protein n=1 Tax=Hymenobacter aquaticus TaxID=1867101 RepID=A0A4Z0Q6W5_9BACT|nr:YcxB family protein [Hymenobacter aquaticus]TGE25445.1 hypothetical protein E5K00_09725 [Hymenobacter aquaticus]